MKSIIILASLLLSPMAFAGDITVDSSWQEIQEAYAEVVINAPKVSFEGRSLSIQEVCIEGDMIRTMKKVNIYTRRDIGDRTVWDVTDYNYLFTPRKYTRTYCESGPRRCTWRTEEREYPVELMIPVNKQPRGDRSFGPLMFVKSYTVPKC